MQNHAKKCAFEEFWATGLWSNPLLIYGAENFWRNKLWRGWLQCSLRTMRRSGSWTAAWQCSWSIRRWSGPAWQQDLGELHDEVGLSTGAPRMVMYVMKIGLSLHSMSSVDKVYADDPLVMSRFLEKYVHNRVLRGCGAHREAIQLKMEIWSQSQSPYQPCLLLKVVKQAWMLVTGWFSWNLSLVIFLAMPQRGGREQWKWSQSNMLSGFMLILSHGWRLRHLFHENYLLALKGWIKGWHPYYFKQLQRASKMRS